MSLVLIAKNVQWIDREGKTPLMAACMSSERFSAARTLIELGADVNAYRPGILPLFEEKIGVFG